MTATIRTRYYIIDNGDLFEGTLEQFQDCFFSNASEELIVAWCEKNGSKLKIEDRPTESA